MTHLATCLLRYRFNSCIETSLIIIHLDCYLDGIANILFSLLVCYLLKFVRTLYSIAPLLCLYLSERMLSIKLTVVSDEVIYLLLLKVLVTKNYHLFYSETAVIYLLVSSNAAEWNRKSIFKHLGNLYYGNVFFTSRCFSDFHFVYQYCIFTE